MLRLSKRAQDDKLTLRWPEVGQKFPFYYGIFWIDRELNFSYKRWNVFLGGTGKGSGSETHEVATGGHADEYFCGNVCPILQPDKNYRMVIYMPPWLEAFAKDSNGTDVLAEVKERFGLIPAATDVEVMTGWLGVPEWARRMLGVSKTHLDPRRFRKDRVREGD